MIRRISMILALVLMAIAVTGCEEALGPLFSIDVEIRGPDRMIGQWMEEDRWSDVPAGYRCEPVLVLRARGGGDTYRSVIRSDAVIRRFDADGNEIGAPQIYAGRDVDYLLGHVSPGRSVETRRIPVVADTLPFRWRLEARYFDPETGTSRSASFSSRCVGA